MLTNLYSVEPLIKQRIKNIVPGLTTVASASILAGAQDIAPYCPAAFVLPSDAEPLGTVVNNVLRFELQRWLVVVCVSNIRDPSDVNTTALAAGGFLLQICQALMGWQPDQYHGHFNLLGRGEPYYDVGYGEFPILFETRIPLLGDAASI